MHRWSFLPEKGFDVTVRVTQAEVCSHDEIAVVHVMSRVVRRCFLFGTDEHSGKCYNHRRAWVEAELKQLAAGFGIDEMVHPSRFNTKRVLEQLGRSI
ncbi:MAG: hypothetical protein U0892_17810 [Pirellulales bacterium]